MDPANSAWCVPINVGTPGRRAGGRFSATFAQSQSFNHNVIMALEIDRNLSLPNDQYFPSQAVKSGICLHHTVGGSASSSINWWKQDDAHVGTAYVIDRDGTIYEAFDPRNWAFQFGLKGWSRDDRFGFEQRFVGIEIASEGGLTESDGELYWLDTVSPSTRFSRDKAFDYGKAFRGYRYFSKYTPAQVDSVVALVNELCDTHGIARQIPANYLEFYGQELRDFHGVIGHINVREDKSDPIPDKHFWQRVIDECSLSTIDVGVQDNSVAASSNPASDEVNLDQLFKDNVDELIKMKSMAGSLVKQLILELKKFDTYIRLRDAEAGGHTVHYDFVQGDRRHVEGIALALDVFDEVTDSKLVVFS